MNNKSEYIDLKDNRSYTKVFQFTQDNVEFSKSSYMGYWFYLIRQMFPNENTIWVMKNSRKHYASSIEDLAGICGVKTSTFYKFFKEAKSKSYIMRADKGEDVDIKFVINPKYALNGNSMLRDLYILFNKNTPDDIMVDDEKNYQWV